MKRRAPYGQHRVVAVELGLGAVHRLELASLEGREGKPNGLVLVPASKTQQPLLGRLAQVGDDVIAHERVADAASCQRGSRTAERDQTPVLLEELPVPGLGTVPRHRAPRILAP